MSSPVPPTLNELNDPRVYLAVERTFLAWIRTGLALMGFGFVVARFGIFLQEFSAAKVAKPLTRGVSVRFGTALVLLGVVLTIAALIRYVHLLRRLKNGEKLYEPSHTAIALGTVLAVIGGIISGYLVLSW